MKDSGSSAQELVTRRAEYVELIGRLRQSVPRQVPPGAQLLVVSRGDDELLQIPGIDARHFPQDADGRYAGHYPHDSTAAIEHLEAHQQGRAAFLLFPATSLWWLDHYEGFREHLDTRYRRVRSDADCVIYDVRLAAAAADTLDAGIGLEAQQLWAQIRGLLDALLQPEDGVVVLVREASDAIFLGTRPVERALLGTVLAADAHESRPPRGQSRFLVIPHLDEAGSDEASRATAILFDSHRLVARHEAACTILERRPPDASRSGRHLRSIPEGGRPLRRKAGG